jgi:hypothetical protein
MRVGMNLRSESLQSGSWSGAVWRLRGGEER